MAVTRNQKKEILEELTGAVGKGDSLVFVNFHGLNVENINALRSKLKKGGIGYKVAKKTLLKKALETLSLTGTQPALEGEIAVAFLEKEGGDITAPSREVFAFAKGKESVISIVGGVYEKAYLDKAGMTEIATIPDMHTLRGMFVNLINSPIQGLAVALNAIAGKKA